jgi:cytochrome c-type biogenesis protein CcmH
MPRNPDLCRLRWTACAAARCTACAIAFLLAAWLPQPVRAADTPLEFRDPAQQLRYQKLLGGLRCLVCQNQTLADSGADLAQDLRQQIYERISRGESNQEIVAFLVARYGDFVLYQPPLQENTWILWFGPFVLLIIAVVVLIRVAGGRHGDIAQVVSDAEQKRIRELVAGRGSEGSSE